MQRHSTLEVETGTMHSHQHLMHQMCVCEREKYYSQVYESFTYGWSIDAEFSGQHQERSSQNVHIDLQRRGIRRPEHMSTATGTRNTRFFSRTHTHTQS